MKKLIILLLVFHAIFSFAQKNEISTFFGKSSNQLYYQLSDVFQISYERKMFKTVHVALGLRYHDELFWDNSQYDIGSHYIRNTFNSYKIDFTLFLVPIESEKFSFKIGVGPDIGFSLYSSANRSIIRSLHTPEGEKEMEYWQYDICKIQDYGVHFAFAGNYYFRNKLFCSLQLLFNQVFNEEEYIPEIVRISPLCLSVGFGYRF